MTQKFVALHFLSCSIHKTPAARLFTTFSQLLQKTTFVSQSTQQMNQNKQTNQQTMPPSNEHVETK